MLRTGRWISFTLAALVAIIAFGLLSSWQWHRALEEQAKAAAANAGSSATPVPLRSVVEPGRPLPADEEWRSVEAAGDLRCDSGYLVRNRPLDGTNGFWAVCPLRMPDGAWVWVNRGWLAAPGPAVREVAMPAAPTGPVLVVGRLRASESASPAIPADLPAGQAKSLDTEALAAASGLDGPLFAPYVEATGIQPADPGGLRPVPLPPADSAQNYSYAGQWLLFAGITVGGWFYFLRREAAEEGASSPPAA